MKVKVINQPSIEDLKHRDNMMKHIYHYMSKICEIVDTIDEADVIWLGEQHIRMDLDWPRLVNEFGNKVVIIDQADDTEFVEEKDTRPYKDIPNKLLLTRYDYNFMISRLGRSWGCPVHVMPFMLCPDLMPKIEKEKDIDMCMVMDFSPSIYHFNRTNVETLLKEWMAIHNFNLVTGFVSDHYYDVLARSRIAVMDGSGRRCMTGKYLEACYYGCELIGEIPFFPIGIDYRSGDYSIFFNDGFLKSVLAYAEGLIR